MAIYSQKAAAAIPHILAYIFCKKAAEKTRFPAVFIFGLRETLRAFPSSVLSLLISRKRREEERKKSAINQDLPASNQPTKVGVGRMAHGNADLSSRGGGEEGMEKRCEMCVRLLACLQKAKTSFLPCPRS